MPGILNVGDNDARIIRPKDTQRIFRAGECLCVISGQRQPLANRLTHVLFIIHNRDFHGLCHCLLRRLFRRFTVQDRQLHFKYRATLLAISRCQSPAEVCHDLGRDGKPKPDTVTGCLVV